MQIYNMYKLLYGLGDRKMSAQMTIRVDPEIKKRFNKVVRAEGKTSGQALKELIENYIKEREPRTYIDDLWGRIGGKLRSKGVRQRGIDKAIKELRKSRG
jgi:predicted DNA-binding protein